MNPNPKIGNRYEKKPVIEPICEDFVQLFGKLLISVEVIQKQNKNLLGVCQRMKWVRSFCYWRSCQLLNLPKTYFP